MANEFTWPVRVYYEDTDAGGVVYHANYLKYMERARTEWLRARGFEQAQLRDQAGIVFAVRQMKLDFLRPALFDQALEVSAKLTMVGHASLSLEQEVRAIGGPVCCRAQVKIACIDIQRFRATPLPKNLIEGITNVE